MAVVCDGLRLMATAFRPTATERPLSSRACWQRERWAKAGASAPKGHMQPGSVFDAKAGGIVYGGPGEREPGTGPGPQEQRDYYRAFDGAAGVKTQHQAGQGTASEVTVRRSNSAPGFRSIQQGAGNAAAINEVGSGLGHHTKPVRADAFDGAFGSTTRMVNSTMPELKASLMAEGAIGASAESRDAYEAGDKARRYRFDDDVPEIVFNSDPSRLRKQQEVRGLNDRAGSDTHALNKRDLNARYHDAGRYGRYGRGKPPATDGNTATISQALFSAPKPVDFMDKDGDGLVDRLEGGAANYRLDGAAGASTSAVAEMEPLMRYRAPADQTERQRNIAEANAASKRELNFAPEVEAEVFNRPTGDVSRLSPAPCRQGSPSPRPSSSSRWDRLASPRGGRAASPGNRASMTSAQRFAQRQQGGGGGNDVAAGTSTHELSQKEPLYGGPGGPDHAVRQSRIPEEAKPTRDEAREVLHSVELEGRPPNQTQQLRQQRAYVKAAGASTQEVEQQLHDLPVDRNHQRPAPRAAERGGSPRGASPRGGSPQRSRGPPTPSGSSNPHNRLFERPQSPRNSKGAAGMRTGKLAERDPYFVTDLDAGVKMCAQHPSKFGQVVFGSKSPAAQRLHGDTELEHAPEYKGRLGIPSSMYGARDPLVVGDCPPGNESKSSTTWKSQVDEVLYGVDLDGSGDYAAMKKELDAAPQYQGAAGVSSLANANKHEDFTVEVNTRIHTTYAKPERQKGGKPIAEPLKAKKTGSNAPELFSKAGVADWVNNPRQRGAHAGRDELWKHGTKEPPPRAASSDFNFSTESDHGFGKNL